MKECCKREVLKFIEECEKISDEHESKYDKLYEKYLHTSTKVKDGRRK